MRSAALDGGVLEAAAAHQVGSLRRVRRRAVVAVVGRRRGRAGEDGEDQHEDGGSGEARPE
jgi:molybdopterin synthase catalytic subunit